MAKTETKELTKEEMYLPDFNYKEVEALYEHNLTIPDELYDSLLQKERRLLIEDLEKLLKHAIDKFEVFNADEVPVKQTFFVWHAMFLLKDIEAWESLPAFIDFLKQDEDFVGMYLGDSMAVFGWEVFYALGKGGLRPLIDFAKDLPDDFTYRVEIVEALKQILLHQPERKLEIESYLRELLLYVATVNSSDDGFIDELTDKVLEAIGSLGLTRLYPEVEKLLEQEKLTTLLPTNYEDFERQYVTKADPFKKMLRTRNEIYGHYLEAQDEMDEDEDDNYYLPEDFQNYLDDLDENDADEDFLYSMDEEVDEEKDPEEKKTYLDYIEVHTPFVKTEPDVGRNDPCPCGSGKKYKKCHGKS